MKDKTTNPKAPLLLKIGKLSVAVRLTMGALLRFKEMTGRDVSQARFTDFSDLITLIYCCIVSVCRSEGKAFDLSLEDFADQVPLEEMNALAAALGDPGEKKTATELPQPPTELT